MGGSTGVRGITSSRRAEERRAVEDEADLLERLADSGLQQVGVSGLAAAARQRHVPRPGIAGVLGAADEEDRVGRGRDDDRDRRPDQAGIVRTHHRLVPREALAQPGKAEAQWLWEWHPPPQHPPPGGGPSRLKSAGFPAVAGRAVSDMSRSSFRPLQLGQATLVSERTSCSNSASQAAQRYV